MGNYVKRVLEKQEVTVGILSCYINMIHPDLTIREELLTKFEQYLRYASSFGASMVASETGCVLPEIQYTEENFTDEAFAEAVSVRYPSLGKSWRKIPNDGGDRTRFESSGVFFSKGRAADPSSRFGLSRNHFRSDQSQVVIIKNKSNW